MSNWLAYLGGAIVALLAALFAVPAMIDWNGYRGIFEEEATRVLGRDVRLGGSVNLRLLPAPYVSFQKMRISDPDSQTGEPLFRAESFTMWLAISPLLQGVLQANQIELKQPILKLAVSEDGTGNWSKLRLTPGALPFVPADVALNSVKLSDGEIGLVGPKGNELAKLEAVNGELTADALSGPVRFRGHVKWGGELRDVRFASASPEPNGDVRFKVSATGTGTHSSYILDGRAAGLGGKLNLTGDLAAKIAPDLSAATRAPDAPAPPPPAAVPAPAPEVTVSTTPGAEPKAAAPPPPVLQTGAPIYDMRSKVSGDASGLKLSEIAITSESGGPPQLVTGEAQATWGERTKLDMALNSRWIDLDAMFGTGKTVVPLEAARGLFDVLMRQLPASSDTNIDLRVDQLNLGADQISDVHFAAVRSGGPLEIKDFRVALPGATQLSLAGKLAPGEQSSPKFEGTVGLKGQSLSRFLAWGLKRPALTDGLSDGAFALNGNLKFSGKQIELADAKVGIGDTPVTASVRLDLADRRKLAVNLEGQKIDIGRIWPGGLEMETLAPLLAQATSAADAAKTAHATADGEQPWFDPANSDLVIGVKAGSLVDGTRALRNVEADVSIEDGKLAMRQLKFADDAGLEVELEGEAAGLGGGAKGSVRGLIVAPDTATAKTFVDLAGLDTYAPGLVDYFTRLAPFRLAGSLDLGSRVPTAADVRLDGTVRGGRLVASVDLDGGLRNWRTAPAGISARIEAPDVDQAASALIGATLPANLAGATPRPGQIVFRAAGAPRDGLLTFAAIQASDLKLDYTGRMSFPADAPLSLKGEAQVASRDTRVLLQLAGVTMPDATSAIPLAGVVSIDKSGETLTLTPAGLTLSGTPVAGTLSVKKSGTGRTAITADLQAAEASVTGLLTALLDREALTPPAPTPVATGKSPQPPPAPVDQPPELWPDQQFDFSALNDTEGKITLRIGKLALQPGLSVANAKLDIALEPGRVSVTSLEGDALGGKVTSAMTFAKEAAGVKLDGGMDLRVPHDGGKSDIAGLSLKFNGRALSPAALIGGLDGKGELKLGDISLGGMSPAIVGSVAEAALTGRGPNAGEPLVAALRNGLREGQLKIGELAVPVTFADGAMKLAKVELDRAEGRTTFETVVELATMKIDSEWNVEAKLPKSVGKAGAKPLPPVSVIYTGTLKDIAAIEPQISAAALERELTVRKMEHDVEELERLRKEDEQRAKEEQARIAADKERLRQEKAQADAARAAAAAAAAVDDPQPAPDANAAAGASVDQAPLPPAGAEGQLPGNAPQPQSGTTLPPGAAPAAGAAAAPPGSAQQAAGTDTALSPEAAAAQAAPRPPAAKRKPAPQKDNWNPFTSQF